MGAKRILTIAIIAIIGCVASILAQNYIIREEISPSLGYLILATVAVVILLFYKLFLSNKGVQKKKRKEPKAWELEDQLKELEEQCSTGAISPVEYEQRKKKLLEESKA